MKFYAEATLLMILPAYVAFVSCAPTFQPQNEQRQAKNLPFFDYAQPEADYDGYAIDSDDYVSLAIEENDIGRTIPARKRFRPEYNSPIYYIRLPPQPYMFVPGLGYVSQPPTNPMSPFVNVPVSFVSNGKPNSIYQWTGGIEIPTVAPHPATTLKPKPARKPVGKPDSSIHRLPGQFAFNGRPDEIFVLRDSYNSLYGDVLQNLYP
ncbi:uncharacterized protein LOC132699643 [Cylas formicarius]|uniref:uncharacterized protein LOC132699643 n=1 Tax=Cylas formicarius TaxID=197179 RepID=UPI0029585F70|nr:uncharacterized protein LOC132699643 [Cylas formicarius]